MPAKKSTTPSRKKKPAPSPAKDSSESSLDSRISTVERKIEHILDEIGEINRRINSVMPTTSKTNQNLNDSEIISIISSLGRGGSWITIDAAYGLLDQSKVGFDSFQAKIIELSDRNKLELGEGRSFRKITSRGSQFGLLRLLS